MNKKPQRLPRVIATATVEKFSHDGRGLARINGKTTFLQGALPQETVSFQYTRVKRDFDEGRVVEVLTPSAQRVTPRCPHYQICGGCSMQHLDASAQIEIKQQLLLDSLQRIGHVQPETVLAPLADSAWNYRNKARLSTRFPEKKQTVLIGFRERNKPGFVADIDECPVLNAKIAKKIKDLKILVNSLDAPGTIAQVELSAGDEELALVFRNLQALSANDQEKLCEFAKKTGFKLFLQPGDQDSVTRLYPESGEDYLHYALPEESIVFKFHPNDFTQVNAGLNRLMVRKALDLMQLDSKDRVADLFCGLGNFSLPMAKYAARVIGIEGNARMVTRAEMNARANGIDNASFYCADLDQENCLSAILKEPVNKMLVDPPRSGALQIARQIHKFAIKRLVYVSCNPATLARDADILVNQQGYALKATGVMDMFPHTAHVESIALFEKV